MRAQGAKLVAVTAGTVIGMEGTRRRLGLASAALAVAVGAALAVGSTASAGEPAFSLDPVGDFEQPVHVDDAPGDDKRLFVVEKQGKVRVVVNGNVRKRPFLNITERVEAGGEQGLLSIAFHPKYATNRRFYVFYVNHDDGNDLQVDQFKRRAASRVRAVKSSRRTVIKVQHNQANNHNGGQLQFGPDRNLYIATGDGGPQTDPENDAQKRSSLLGKILRIRPKGTGGYTVPTDNPYAQSGGRDEIWALGLRNPFRFSFDSQSGALTIGDVGGSDWEEVDYVADPPPGLNFGWNDYEGAHETTFGIGPLASPHTPPIHEYANAGSPACAVTGGYVVRDPGLPPLAGQYLFADYCLDGLRTITVPAGAPGTPVGLSPQDVVSFGEGPGRQIYVVSLGGEVSALELAP